MLSENLKELARKADTQYPTKRSCYDTVIVSGKNLKKGMFQDAEHYYKSPPWFEHGTARSAIVCSTTEL